MSSALNVVKKVVAKAAEITKDAFILGAGLGVAVHGTGAGEMHEVAMHKAHAGHDSVASAHSERGEHPLEKQMNEHGSKAAEHGSKGAEHGSPTSVPLPRGQEAQEAPEIPETPKPKAPPHGPNERSEERTSRHRNTGFGREHETQHPQEVSTGQLWKGSQLAADFEATDTGKEGVKSAFASTDAKVPEVTSPRLTSPAKAQEIHI